MSDATTSAAAPAPSGPQPSVSFGAPPAPPPPTPPPKPHSIPADRRAAAVEQIRRTLTGTSNDAAPEKPVPKPPAKAPAAEPVEPEEDADAPEATDADDAAETPAAEAPKPTETAPRFVALARKEKAFREAKRQHAAERQAFEHERTQLAAAREAQSAQAAEFKRFQEALTKAKDDPDALAELLGVEPGDYYNKWTSKSLVKGTPDEIRNQVEQLRAEMRAKDAAIAKQAAEREQREREAQATAHTRSQEAAFTGEVRGGATRYPILSTFPEATIVAYGHKAADLLARHYGRAPTFTEIADALEADAKATAERQAAALGYVKAPAVAPAPAVTAPDAGEDADVSAVVAVAQKRRSITAAARSAGAPRVPTREERKRQAAQQVRDVFYKKAA